MFAARMHGDKQALVLDETKTPEIELLRAGDIIGRAVIVFDV